MRDDLVTITRWPAALPRETAVACERAVREALAGESGPLEVQFGT